MELASFNNKPKWVEIRDGFKVLVDYPTVEQKYKLEQMQFEGIEISEGLPKNFNLASFNKSVRYFLKFTIKDWDGLDEGGVPVKCILDKGELNKELWEALIKYDDLVFEIYGKINEVLRWNETDKKKFILSEDSDLKAD